MDPELQARLRRLGVVKGTRNLKPARSPAETSQPSPAAPEPDAIDDLGPNATLAQLFPGGRLEAHGDSSCFVVDRVYPLSHRHGRDQLGDALRLATGSMGPIASDARLDQIDPFGYAFLDTETTGLSGSGVLAFLVGVAFFEARPGQQPVLIARQYLLRDPGDEPAMLDLLDETLAERQALVTFNGRAFDVPLLEGRYLINRRPAAISEIPHLDLLPPSRRLWGNRLDSCALGSLEVNVLGLQRTGQDVSGSMIPYLYRQFLLDGDARPLARIAYHNEIDLLSMITLVKRVLDLFDNWSAGEHPIDLFSLGRWRYTLGHRTEAEKALRQALQGDLPLHLYHKNLHLLGRLLKRSGRREEAVPLWQQWAASSLDRVTAHVELAMHYEWQRQDYEQAQSWTLGALALLEKSAAGAQSEGVAAALEHRLRRLQRKAAAAGEG